MKAKRRQQTANERIEEIDLQIETLRDQRKDERREVVALTKAMRIEDKGAHSHLVAIGKAQCRKLCDALYSTLPHELRDMIYGYVLGTRPVERVSTAGDWLIPYFHFLDNGYTGSQVWQEMIQAWITSTRFSLRSGCWDELPKMLKCQPWGFGQPIYRFMLQIELYMENYEDLDDDDYPPDYPILEDLALLKPSTRVTLHKGYCSPTSWTQSTLLSSFEHHISRLWPCISRFDQARLKIVVQLYYITGVWREDTLFLGSGKKACTLSQWVAVLEQASEDTTVKRTRH